MKYKKLPLTSKQQADLLLSRGLIVDRDRLITKLNDVNYYRLSTYLFPYRGEKDNFKKDTTFDNIWRQYTFDRQIRLLLMDAIERFEVSIKTRLTSYLTNKTNSPFPHTDFANLDPNSDRKDFNNLLDKIKDNANKSSELFIKHFETKYLEEEHLPLWVAIEIMTFGNIFTLYKLLPKHDQKNIALCYNTNPMVFITWLKAINYVRNLCAHHSRVWNRELAIKPYAPKKRADWNIPIIIRNRNNKIFSIFTILKYLMSYIAPNSKWQDRVEELFNKYPEVSTRNMGFPDDWKECPIWDKDYNKDSL